MGAAFFINGLANNAVIPIAHKLSVTYDISATYADSPVLVSFLVYSLMNFPANHLIDTKGLRLSLLIGTCLYACGLGLFAMINVGYHWVLLGAILVALGQPFVINCPAKVATFWFKSKNVNIKMYHFQRVSVLLTIYFFSMTLKQYRFSGKFNYYFVLSR